MKKILLSIIILVCIAFQGIAQDKLKIGEVVNGKLKITNETALRSFFLNNLENSGCLAKDIKVEPSPDADRYMVYTRVTDNKKNISCIGVMLVRSGNEAFIAKPAEGDEAPGPGAGGSATYSCEGDPCPDCEIDIDWPSGSWLPNVECACSDPDGTCNMTVSVTITITVGL